MEEKKETNPEVQVQEQLSNKIFITERIININELEEMISIAVLNISMLKNLIVKKENRGIDIENLIEIIDKQMEEIKEFEFCLEHRKVSRKY